MLPSIKVSVVVFEKVSVVVFVTTCEEGLFPKDCEFNKTVGDGALKERSADGDRFWK